MDSRRGHPVLFPWHWTTRVRQLSAGQGLNALLQDGAALEIDCSDLLDSAALGDVDTPQGVRTRIDMLTTLTEGAKS